LELENLVGGCYSKHCEWLGRWQTKLADRHAMQLGCHWNRETLELVRQAGLKVHNSRRVFFGVFHQIEAVPGPV
jgi:hypothetical protein